MYRTLKVGFDEAIILDEIHEPIIGYYIADFSHRVIRAQLDKLMIFHIVQGCTICSPQLQQSE